MYCIRTIFIYVNKPSLNNTKLSEKNFDWGKLIRNRPSAFKDETALTAQEKTKLATLLGYLQSDNFEAFLNETFTGIYPDDDILTLMKLMTSRKPGLEGCCCWLL
jgi:hypothetical protein